MLLPCKLVFLRFQHKKILKKKKWSYKNNFIMRPWKIRVAKVILNLSGICTSTCVFSGFLKEARPGLYFFSISNSEITQYSHTIDYINCELGCFPVYFKLWFGLHNCSQDNLFFHSLFVSSEQAEHTLTYNKADFWGLKIKGELPASE